MAVVINESNKERYTINPYSLRVIQSEKPEAIPTKGIRQYELKEFDESEGKPKSEQPSQQSSEQTSDDTNQEDQTVQADQSELIESLLKKADDFSSKYVKAQMDLEDALSAQEHAVQEAKQTAYNEGYEKAKQEFENTQSQEQDALQGQLKESIALINEESTKFQTALDDIQQELIGAALDIAKEVIVKEVSQDSSEVVKSLATALLQEIKQASTVTIKVHPSHESYLKEALSGNDKVTIQASRAIIQGGVVLESDIGVIEADIMKRYEKVKREALRT